MKKRMLSLILGTFLALSITACGSNGNAEETSATVPDTMVAETTVPEESIAIKEITYPRIVEDKENQALYEADEEGLGTGFAWYKWEFEIDPQIDAVGDAGDGIGELYFRLFTPELEDGKEYPLVMILGGLGSKNSMSFAHSNYAGASAYFATESNQAANPSFLMNFNVPFEACVNFEAEMEYIYQHGELIKYLKEQGAPIDMKRIYAAGGSQGAGWCYELAAAQPDLLAAIFANSGTTVHTTWGDQCDMQAIADSDVNVYIWSGTNDPFIPINEGYRAYNTLTALGKKNVIACFEYQEANMGHTNATWISMEGPTDMMNWLFAQEKGTPCTEEPQLTVNAEPTQFSWAGVQVFSGVPFNKEPVWSGIENWQINQEYANWIEPQENPTWNEVKQIAIPLTAGEGGTGKTWLSRVRIGDERATTYDESQEGKPAFMLPMTPGDIIAVTVQGYTGLYGDDWYAFNKEWTVEWAVLAGSVTNIELTCEASDEPLLRPANVDLANGGGPNVNNSLYNENTLDGNQVYIRIDTAKEFEGDTLGVALRFTRNLGNGEYASYYHVIACDVAK